MLYRLLDETELVPLALEFFHRVAESRQIDLASPSAEDLCHPVGEEGGLKVVRDQQEGVARTAVAALGQRVMMHSGVRSAAASRISPSASNRSAILERS